MHSYNDNINVFERFNLDQNIVDFSALKEYYGSVQSEGFSVKYVIEGIERYDLNGQKYPIESGKYLLSNNIQEGHVEIKSPKQVKGICINITPEMIAEVVATMRRPDTPCSDVALGHYFTSSLFFDNQYDATQTHLGRALLEMSHTMLHNRDWQKGGLNIELFYILTEKIIADQIPIFKQLQSIPSLKSETKKDLLRRVSKGKEFIDTAFLKPLTIEQVSKEVTMSEYHFFRLFKSIYGISPHQYILKKRLEYGQNILKQDRIAVSVAAYDAGFADIHAFSKAFKKHFGYAPSALLK
jgi:AraC family transcriptional regulator